jgi:hypothetical protein
VVELSLIDVWNTIQLGDAQARTVVVLIYGEDAIGFIARILVRVECPR